MRRAGCAASPRRSCEKIAPHARHRPDERHDHRRAQGGAQPHARFRRGREPAGLGRRVRATSSPPPTSRPRRSSTASWRRRAPATASSWRSAARSPGYDKTRTAGSSIRSTARRTSCTACRCSPSRSGSSAKASSSPASIYNPISDELFTAEKGKGAYLNDRRACASRRARTSADALITIGIPHRGRAGMRASSRSCTGVMERGCRRPPHRLSRPRSRLDGGRPFRRLLGAQPSTLGHGGRHRAGARSGRLRQRSQRRRQHARKPAASSPPTPRCTRPFGAAQARLRAA